MLKLGKSQKLREVVNCCNVLAVLPVKILAEYMLSRNNLSPNEKEPRSNKLVHQESFRKDGSQGRKAQHSVLGSAKNSCKGMSVCGLELYRSYGAIQVKEAFHAWASFVRKSVELVVEINCILPIVIDRTDALYFGDSLIFGTNHLIHDYGSFLLCRRGSVVFGAVDTL